MCDWHRGVTSLPSASTLYDLCISCENDISLRLGERTEGVEDNQTVDSRSRSVVDLRRVVDYLSDLTGKENYYDRTG